MKILIIGGTGNISSEVTPLLIEQGHDVTVLTSGIRPVPFNNVTHIKVNRFDPMALYYALQGKRFDVTIDFMSFNAVHSGTLYHALEGGIGQYIFISSAVVYRKGSNPIIEETVIGNDNWDYAQGKIDCEQWLAQVRKDEFPVTIVRPSHTFGNTWIPSLLDCTGFTLAKRMLRGEPVILHDNGESKWVFTSSSDFAKGLVGLIGNEKACGETFHITSDEVLTWNEIYKGIGKALGVEPNIEYIPLKVLSKYYPRLIGDRAETTYFDNSKIKKFVPGFECKKRFEQMIQESVNWFMADPARQYVNEGEYNLQDRIINDYRNAQSK